ncbi:TIGR03083 family protein [Streptomyces sp. DvalAA-14]|uniref:maleylpyruvate isomerase family mycothiol-dependent enzyme n=1 Tax=unclassified Streptomyces TaxID=2593676 RepID=UPI00081B3C1D|nr:MULTISPECIES: maleylpyruvate isomerase family mycothiol-dependent enzyme [unclassified Streptomyces]MYS24148.1 maleylpyruvate isomerase family mycothiol-dependent enzyme [Streptomyces sp. SID4948]SCE43082.1 TIGR03083 family protein [Streptomyces sp. DvalAA-14]
MAVSADHVISVLRTGHDRLAAFVRKLAPGDLTHSSGASAWDVSQVLSHLGSGAEINLATLRGALAGTGNPGADFNKSTWARWDAMSPADRADGFLASDEALVAAYEELDGPTRAELRIDLGFTPQPVDVATAGTFRLSELAFHVWDVEVGFDATAGIFPEAVPVLQALMPMYAGFSSNPAALDGRHAELAVELSDPAASLGLNLGETVTVGTTPDKPDGVLTAPAEWWLRLVAGRHAPEHTPASVSLTGDAVRLDDLRRVFPGF